MRNRARSNCLLIAMARLRKQAAALILLALLIWATVDAFAVWADEFNVNTAQQLDALSRCRHAVANAIQAYWIIESAVNTCNREKETLTSQPQGAAKSCWGFLYAAIEEVQAAVPPFEKARRSPEPLEGRLVDEGNRHLEKASAAVDKATQCIKQATTDEFASQSSDQEPTSEDGPPDDGETAGGDDDQGETPDTYGGGEVRPGPVISTPPLLPKVVSTQSAPSAFIAELKKCLEVIRQKAVADSKSPINRLLTELERIPITVHPRPSSDSSNSTAYSPPGEPVNIYWSAADKGRYADDEASKLPCTTLLHELTHAWEYYNGYNDNGELVAVRAENWLIWRLNGTQRTKYDGRLLPPNQVLWPQAASPSPP